MKRVIAFFEYWLCSGHRFGASGSSVRGLSCRASSLCLGCDGKVNCHLAKRLAFED